MISFEQFLLRQPAAPEVTETDKYYFDLCNELIEIAKEKKIFPSYPEKVVERAAICLIGYYQDVISDAGIWRTFIKENRRLYNKTLPFYDTGQDYIDFEMNREDVRFMVWYALSMNYENLRVAYPLEEEIVVGADTWWEYLEKRYDDAPIPQDFRLVRELEIQAPEDRQIIMKLANWLFLHCYLMTPAFALTLALMATKYNLTDEEGLLKFQQKLDESISTEPTGPLALFIGEWLYLIIEGKAPKERESLNKEEHKYYRPFLEANNGEEVKFFSSYEELNKFFISALGWEPEKEHLSQIKGSDNYVLLIDKHRGLLVARDVAQFIAAPGNLLYNKEIAAKESITLLTVRGRCPADLVKYCCRKGWLPDAVFPGTNDTKIVQSNYDFIMRCYLQDYYRD